MESENWFEIQIVAFGASYCIHALLGVFIACGFRALHRQQARDQELRSRVQLLERTVLQLATEINRNGRQRVKPNESARTGNKSPPSSQEVGGNMEPPEYSEYMEPAVSRHIYEPIR